MELAFGIDKIKEIINEICDSGDIPEYLRRPIFVAQPNRPSANEGELYGSRTI